MKVADAVEACIIQTMLRPPAPSDLWTVDELAQALVTLAHDLCSLVRALSCKHDADSCMSTRFSSGPGGETLRFTFLRPQAMMHLPVVIMRSSILPSMQFETALKRKAFPEREWKLCSLRRFNVRRQPTALALQ